MPVPPPRPPLYFDASLGGEASLSPASAFHQLAFGMEIELSGASYVQHNTRKFRCARLRRSPDQFAAEFELGSSKGMLQLEISLAQSGWIMARLLSRFFECTIYMERAYEEWDLWPAGSDGRGDAPGRLGKRLNWAQLELKDWPDLAMLGSGPWLTIETCEISAD